MPNGVKDKVLELLNGADPDTITRTDILRLRYELWQLRQRRVAKHRIDAYGNHYRVEWGFWWRNGGLCLERVPGFDSELVKEFLSDYHSLKKLADRALAISALLDSLEAVVEAKDGPWPLSEQQRTIIRLHYMTTANWTQSRIAKQLNVSQKTISKLLADARARIEVGIDFSVWRAASEQIYILTSATTEVFELPLTDEEKRTFEALLTDPDIDKSLTAKAREYACGDNNLWEDLIGAAYEQVLRQRKHIIGANNVPGYLKTVAENAMRKVLGKETERLDLGKPEARDGEKRIYARQLVARNEGCDVAPFDLGEY